MPGHNTVVLPWILTLACCSWFVKILTRCIGHAFGRNVCLLDPRVLGVERRHSLAFRAREPGAVRLVFCPSVQAKQGLYLNSRDCSRRGTLLNCRHNAKTRKRTACSPSKNYRPRWEQRLSKWSFLASIEYAKPSQELHNPAMQSLQGHNNLQLQYQPNLYNIVKWNLQHQRWSNNI